MPEGDTLFRTAATLERAVGGQTVTHLDAAVRRTLLETASRPLRANLDGYPRRTVPEGLAVYERAGRPCRACGTTTVSDHQGDQARVTFRCPSCQPASTEPA